MPLYGAWLFIRLAVLPRWKKDPNNGFWVYVERLAFVIALALLCTLILTVSLQLALFSIRVLFEVNIDWRWEETIWLFGFSFSFLFSPMWVCRISIASLNPFTTTPFCEAHCLLPFTSNFFSLFWYFGVYVAQILITWEWPSGQVAYPVCIFPW